jgi:hypothetical protein
VDKKGENMTMLQIQSAKRNEKGIALLFSLIMLSLLMVLALGFALDSMFEQKAAYNSASSSSAVFLAKSQLQQVLNMMKYGEGNYDSSRIYSYNSDSAAPTILDTDMLKEHLPFSFILEADDSCLDPTVKVKWNYIRNGSAVTDPIVGRTAFVVIPDDKVPLDSLVDGRAGGTTVYPTHNEKDNWETRIGKYVSEINVRGAIPAVTSNISTITETLNWEDISPPVGFLNGKYTGLWPSYTNLFTELETAIGSSLSTADKAEMEDKLSLVVDDDAEAFWVDLNDDKILDSTELFKRFDLTRIDWDTTNLTGDLDKDFIRTKLLLDSGNTGEPSDNMETWSNTDTDSTSASKGLPWLAAFGYDKDGVLITKNLLGRFDSVYDQRCQVAANLKDYCDSDDRPTSDVAPKDWYSSASVPKFTGNEKTPYINKVGVQISVSEGKAPGATTYFWSIINIRPYVELINIFGDGRTLPFLQDLKIRIVGKVIVKVDDIITMAEFDDAVIDFDMTHEVGNSWDAESGMGYKFLQFTSFERKLPDSNPPYNETLFSGLAADPTIQVDIKEVIISKVVLYKKDNSAGYDYVKELDKGSSITSLYNGNSGTNYCWYGWAAHDPRQNFNKGDWKYTGEDASNDATQVLSLTGPAPYTGNANALNPVGVKTTSPSAVADYFDKETGDDPSDGKLSTAFIRNDPMESPWELGFIHRGYMWQTINLKKHDKDKAIKFINVGTSPNIKQYIPGGGEYASGDANILDQIKMTAAPKSPQRISLRSSTLAVFQALLSKIRLGCAIDSASMSVKTIAGIDPATGTIEAGTVELTSSEIDAIGNNIINKYRSANIEDMQTRSSVVDKLLLPMSSPAINALTDAEQEELISKIINLTKISSQGAGGSSGRFTILILAQTIKDFGTTSGIPITKASLDGSETATKNCKIGVFDADFAKNIYFDEITSEQKILVTAKDTTTGGIELISFQYID